MKEIFKNPESEAVLLVNATNPCNLLNRLVRVIACDIEEAVLCRFVPDNIVDVKPMFMQCKRSSKTL